eukprot:CAMPEP_0169455464 /NCGR_PEP_ID=MMETSP1042-20121227/15828_1 /TAXON_ID=464988 /ORGANISM="Hemiselmis andersenii, Strain CCMP1180" /LENGTH=139 /DNA_ID=CAMNT_0009567611 /DNA_START=272 /DNA_END=691 /DNA_ORIENTATION=+
MSRTVMLSYSSSPNPYDRSAGSGASWPLYLQGKTAWNVSRTLPLRSAQLTRRCTTGPVPTLEGITSTSCSGPLQPLSLREPSMIIGLESIKNVAGLTTKPTLQKSMPSLTRLMLVSTLRMLLLTSSVGASLRREARRSS